MPKRVPALMLAFLLTAGLLAKTHVVVSYPYIADLVGRIGRDTVIITTLAQGDWDPHQIVAKPSYIAKMRQADLLIINGAQLEIGWLPQILGQAGNPAVQPGQKGFLDLSTTVELIDKPTAVSRAQGDVHPDGNPHFILDPHLVPHLVTAIALKLGELDASHAADFQANSAALLTPFNDSLRRWDAAMAPLRGTDIVEYHRLYDYFNLRYGLNVSATIEPLPGIPPTAKHLAGLVELMHAKKIRLILQDVFHSGDAARMLASKTGARVILLPHDIGALKEATDIFALYEEIVRRVTQ